MPLKKTSVNWWILSVIFIVFLQCLQTIHWEILSAWMWVSQKYVFLSVKDYYHSLFSFTSLNMHSVDKATSWQVPELVTMSHSFCSFIIFQRAPGWGRRREQSCKRGSGGEKHALNSSCSVWDRWPVLGSSRLLHSVHWVLCGLMSVWLTDNHFRLAQRRTFRHSFFPQMDLAVVGIQDD